MAFSNIDLAALDGSQGFVIKGFENLENFGFSVSNAGDLDGDGFGDLVIGAPGGYDIDFVSGKAYVVLGGSEVGTSGTIKLSELDGSNGFTINESFFGGYTGSSVSSAGDINGDGFDDLIIGAPFADSGTSYVIFGRNTGFEADLSTESLNGTNGFTLSGALFDDRLGSAVSSVGDINGDGFDDLVIGADGAGDYDSYGDRSFAGKSYVVFGGSNVGNSGTIELSELNGANGFTINGIRDSDRTGFSVSSAGDINSDGFDDLVIGAPQALYDSAGISYVVFGGSNVGNFGTIELSELNGANGFIVTDTDRFDKFGYSVSNVGDINGDGFDDLVIGAPGSSNMYGYNNAGKSYVVFGGSDVGSSGAVLLSLLDGSNGFKISGVDSFDGFGRSVSSAGDINGDGIDDLVIGAPFANPQEKESAGESYIIFGRQNGFPVTVDDIGFNANLNLSNLQDTDGLILIGNNPGDHFGDSVSNAGDINGDGIDDLIIGAPNEDPQEANNAGASYVIFGFAALETMGTKDDDVLTGGSGNDTIWGKAGQDILSGKDGQDSLVGGLGNDRIFGGAGDDDLKGQKGNDWLAGNEGQDSISGGAGEDTLIGGLGSDVLMGNADSDRIFGDGGDDRLKGGTGNDLLFGGEDNDHLSGNSHQDLLVGVSLDESKSSFGVNEQDTLEGGSGSDIFVLGNSDRVFYDDGNNFTAGDRDFALITDFDSHQDTIVLRGIADSYSLDLFASTTGSINAKLTYNLGIFAATETIAILENIEPELNINNSAFTFV